MLQFGNVTIPDPSTIKNKIKIGTSLTTSIFRLAKHITNDKFKFTCLTRKAVESHQNSTNLKIQKMQKEIRTKSYNTLSSYMFFIENNDIMLQLIM